MPKNIKVKYRLDCANKAFVIENYNYAKPFASFFPGIAGKYGIPMWVFYVNRGQAIASFGTKNKDRAILEFFPANKSWQLTPCQGFRTFLKLTKNKKTLFYEPFNAGLTGEDFNLTNRMQITSYDLRLEEENSTLGIKSAVEYFTIPQDSYAALVRIVTITNTSRTTQKMQALDGLPQIVPFGTNNFFLKEMGRTIEAWMNAENLDKGVPFYKLDVDPSDRPEVTRIKEGHFYLSFDYAGKKARILKPVVDPQFIFGQFTDFSYPQQFLNNRHYTYPKRQILKSKTPCAFSLIAAELAPKEEKTFYTVIGYMPGLKALDSSLTKITASGYLAEKRKENRNIIAGLTQDIATASSSPELDLYAEQTYLDNIMRGGYPVILGSGPKKQIFYLYSRKHGDLERDYNRFQLQPTYFSQGNGNYRDINQNRRSDVWFNPEIKEKNVLDFLNLIQADGFNPLLIKGSSFRLRNPEEFKDILNTLVSKDSSGLFSFLADKKFTPGEVLLFLEEHKVKLKISYDEFLAALLSNSSENQEVEHGEGFWTDHWTYNLDQVENYLGVYPEKAKEIIFENRAFTFYDNAETVKPRKKKYVLTDGKVRQLHALMPDPEKKEMIHKRTAYPHLARKEYGKGEIYRTTLMNKLLCLLANKLASLDPFGVGIEMEANKPNWFDALNGLPALLGSSLNETFELKRRIIAIKNILEKYPAEKICVTEEIHDFLTGLGRLLEEWRLSNRQDRDYAYWDKSCALKEGYREKTKFGFSGKETGLAAADLSGILDNALIKVAAGLAKALDKKDNIYYGYFINEVVEYSALEAPFVKPTKFKQVRLPFFLETQVHAVKLTENINQAKKLYQATKKSALYDKKLKMYKVTAPLKDMPEEIGRCRVFPPGWLENESVWLHMEYKYLLEILKAGLYEEFYAEFKNLLIPFQDPEKYGRSILENSSFLASSAFADSSLHGNGFVARLSGSTAEFLSIWIAMNAGSKPLFINEKNKLNLCFKPALAGWLFDKKGLYRFNFLSKIKITYHNPKRKNTFGKNAVKPKRIIFSDKDNTPVEIPSEVIPSPYSEQIRARQIKQIDIYLE